MPDLLNLNSAITRVENEALPAAAKLINDSLAQAANLLDAALQKQDAVLGDAITVLDGSANRVVDKVVGELAAWRELLERGFSGTINGNIPFSISANQTTKDKTQ